MTLGRTSSGAIKIKTDGGLRAVGCACCGSCDLCGAVIASAPLLNLIKNATSVSVNYNFPSFSYFPQVSGTETLSWNGVYAFADIQYDGAISIGLVGNCFGFSIGEVSGSNRIVNFYTAGQDCGFPTDPYTVPQFFTIPVNGYNIDAFQSVTLMTSYPPGFYPSPTISISFS